jgi:hypothetical protein
MHKHANIIEMTEKSNQRCRWLPVRSIGLRIFPEKRIAH